MTPDIATRIRSERARLGLTQLQAAERAGISRDQYKQLEDSPRDVRLSTLTRLVQAGYRVEAIAPELGGA